MADLCFCHLNGYAVKDATARNDIETLKTDKVSHTDLTEKLNEVNEHFTEVETQIKSTNVKLNYIPDTAEELPYSNVNSGLEATNVQTAIDEVKNIAMTGSSTASANKISYDNTASGLKATNVQGSIDELRALIDVLIANSGIKYDHTTDIVYIKNADGDWVEWKSGGLLTTYLYQDGEFNTDYITGIQEAKTVYGSGSVSNTGSVITISGTRSGASNLYMNEGIVFTPGLDLSKISKIKVKTLGTDSNGEVHVGICKSNKTNTSENLDGNSLVDAYSTYGVTRETVSNSPIEQIIELDVSTVTSGYLYTLLHIPASSSTISSSVSIIDIEVE